MKVFDMANEVDGIKPWENKQPTEPTQQGFKSGEKPMPQTPATNDTNDVWAQHILETVRKGYKPPKPNIPTLEETAADVMGVSKTDVHQMKDNTPAPIPNDEYQSDVDARNAKTTSLLQQLLEANKPTIDPEQEQRYKKRAAINAIGNGLKQVFTAAQMNKGYLVQPPTDNTTEKSTNAYAQLLDVNKAKLKAYNDMVLSGKIEGLKMNMAADEKDNIRRNQFNINKLNNANEKYKTDVDFQKFLATNDYNWAKLGQEGKIEAAKIFNTEKQNEAKNKIDRSRVAAINYATKTRNETAVKVAGAKATKEVVFTDADGNENTITPDQATSILKVAYNDIISKIPKDLTESDRASYIESNPDLLMLSAYFKNGGLNLAEKETLIGSLYPKYAKQAKVSSRIKERTSSDDGFVDF